MTITDTPRACLDCGRPLWGRALASRPPDHATHKARGLCGGCYNRRAKNGTLDPRPTIRQQTRDSHDDILNGYAALRGRHTQKVIATRLGIHIKTLERILAAHRDDPRVGPKTNQPRPDVCRECGRRVASSSIRAADRPEGTIRYGAHGLCEPCYQATFTPAPTPRRIGPLPIVTPTNVATWVEKAACAAYPQHADWWHPSPGDNNSTGTLRAIEICRGCPVRENCLEDAMTRREHGIWGGMTETQRAKLRRRTA